MELFGAPRAFLVPISLVRSVMDTSIIFITPIPPTKRAIPAITEIARYFEKEIGYKIPPMTPFVGENFNVTRAGIHADGLMKDQEIYNIFDTEKILNRPAMVAIGKTSGLAGIAYWINQHYRLQTDEQVGKNDDIVIDLKKWIDKEYEDGRQTALTTNELEVKIDELSNGKYKGE